jgi:P pilus assembly chaperone PapD
VYASEIKNKYPAIRLIPFSRITLTGVLLSMILPAIAAPSPVEGTQGSSVVSSTKVFELKLGASRIIYHTDSAGAEVSVTNPQDYPILVQGKVYAEDKKTIAPFIVTPPLSRLEGYQQSRLRIIRTGGSADGNKETLQWFCVAGIPPKETDVWAHGKKSNSSSSIQLHLEVSAHECIKLLTRPSAVKGSLMESANDLEWSRQGKQLKVTNPSPFYITLASVSVGGKEVSDIDYVAPGASRSFTLPEGAGGQVKWKIITDEGGESHIFQSVLK